MVSSSEFIRGYSEMIILSLLYTQDDYVYSIVNKIDKSSNGSIVITNPSVLMVIKKMQNENKVDSYNVLNENGVNRKYYTITDIGKKHYDDNISGYLSSLQSLEQLLKGAQYE